MKRSKRYYKNLNELDKKKQNIIAPTKNLLVNYVLNKNFCLSIETDIRNIIVELKKIFIPYYKKSEVDEVFTKIFNEIFEQKYYLSVLKEQHDWIQKELKKFQKIVKETKPDFELLKRDKENFFQRNFDKVIKELKDTTYDMLEDADEAKDNENWEIIDINNQEQDEFVLIDLV